MVQSRTYHGLSLDIAKVGTGRVCYLLLPDGLRDDCLKWLESPATAHDATLVSISGIDWNNALTPWSAEGVFKKAKPFGGHAETFIKDLCEDYFPSIEASLGFKHVERYLAGVSLSGLFAVWCCFKSRSVSGIASISGSLWYDGFAEWTCSQTLSRDISRIYISLGDREKKSKDKRMCEVENATIRVEQVLKEKGAEVKFVLEEDTTHFSPVIPRLGAALDWLLQTGECV